MIFVRYATKRYRMMCSIIRCNAAKAQVPCEAEGARVFGMRPAGRSPAGLLNPPYLTGG